MLSPCQTCLQACKWHLLTLAPRYAKFSTVKMDGIRSSETSVQTRSTWRHIYFIGVHDAGSLRIILAVIRNFHKSGCVTIWWPWVESAAHCPIRAAPNTMNWIFQIICNELLDFEMVQTYNNTENMKKHLNSGAFFGSVIHSKNVLRPMKSNEHEQHKAMPHNMKYYISTYLVSRGLFYTLQNNAWSKVA